MIGPTASFLLGMLVGSPRTADELHALLPMAVELFDDVEEARDLCGHEMPAALVALYDRGPEEVERLLRRLVDFALVDRLEAGGRALYVTRR